MSALGDCFFPRASRSVRFRLWKHAAGVFYINLMKYIEDFLTNFIETY